MKKFTGIRCSLSVLLAIAAISITQAEVCTNNVDLQGHVITNHPFVEIIDGTNSCLTDAAVRSSTISVGQLCGINPTNGAAMTNDLNNLLPLAASRMLVVGDVTAGSFSGDASGLTNLNIGSIGATNLPTFGAWDASGVTVTLQDVIAELSTMTNVTLNSAALATVISNLQQQVDDMYAAQNSITVQVTDDEAANGAALIAAYAAATNMNPSATNRIAVIVPPGRYNLGTTGLVMDTAYIDLIGQTTDRDVQYLYGMPYAGVIKQITDNICIKNITLYNNGMQLAYYDGSDPAAYFPTVNGENTVIQNCKIIAVGGGASTRVGGPISYDGYYEDCVAGDCSFGFFFDSSASASGTFIDCEAGPWSFGTYGTANGTFIRCKAGAGSFGGGSECEANGTFIDCTAGDGSFGGYDGTLATNAILVNCSAGAYSFGQFNTAATNFSYNADGYYLSGGPIRGDGSGLTNLNVESFNGSINVASLPTSGVWNAEGTTVSNATLKDIIADLSTMTNVTLSGEALSTVISNLQQQVDDVYVAQNSITVQVTDDEAANGAALIAAYAAATNMNPSATNRIVVIVPPGRYNLGTIGLVMDTEYIDLIGQTTDREAQYLYGEPGLNNGVIKQTADYVQIENLTLVNNLNLEFFYYDNTEPAAYFPTVPGSNTVLRNCSFSTTRPGNFSMRLNTEYAGVYEHCVGENNSFGTSGAASGTFIDCIGGSSSFGGFGLANGTFIDCIGGYSSFAGTGTASGIFSRCRAGDESFGSGGTVSGIFIGCQGGRWSFGGWDGIVSGTFINCQGGNLAFGGDGGTLSTNAVLMNCIAGTGSFGQFNIAATNFSYNASGHIFAGGPIVGDGSGLTNLNVATAIADGTIDVSKLSSNVVAATITTNDIANWNSGGALSSSIQVSTETIAITTNLEVQGMVSGVGGEFFTPFIITNSAYGKRLLGVFDTPYGNIAIGPDAGSNTTAMFSGFLGTQAGASSSGLYNLFVGSGAGQFSTGTNQYAFGIMAGKNTASTNSLYLGRNAGRYNTKDGYLYLGHLVDAPVKYSEADMWGKMGLIIDGNTGEMWVGATNATTHLRGNITGNGSNLTNLDLSAYIGDNLTWTNGALNAQPGYSDSDAVAAVGTEWPNLDTDSSDDFNGSFTNLTDIPAGLSDGDDDTQLSEEQVVSMVSSNGFVLSENTLLLNGTQPMSGNLDMGGHSITNISTNSLVYANGQTVQESYVNVAGDTVIGKLVLQTNLTIHGQTVIGDVVFAANVISNASPESLIVDGDVSISGKYTGDGSGLTGLVVSNVVGDIAMSKVTGLTNALAEKVDSSSLASVATSGSYTDLADAPELAAIATDAVFSNLTVTVDEIDPALVNGLTNKLETLTADVTGHESRITGLESQTNSYLTAADVVDYVEKTAATNVLAGELTLQTNLTVQGTATFNGLVYIQQMGDLSMGIYTNRP